MKKTTALGFLLVVLGSASAWPQESAPPAAGQDEAAPEGARPSIRVLQHPYDIASFYRSRQGQGLFGYDSAREQALAERYPIASYYRSRQGGALPPLWSYGYSLRPGRGGPGLSLSIGEHGDLFLLAPFLAPVGPLSGVFRIEP